MSLAEGNATAFAGTSRFQVLRLLGEGGVGVVYEALDREQSVHVALKTLRVASPEALFRFKQEFRTLQDLVHPNLVRLSELIEEGGTWFFTMELVQGVDLLEYVRLTPSATEQAGRAARAAKAALDATAPSTAPGFLSPNRTSIGPQPFAPSPLTAPTAPSLRPRGAADQHTADTMGTRTGPERGAPLQPGPRLFSEARLRAAFGQLAEGLDALHFARLVHRDVKPSNVLVQPDGRVVILDFGLAIEVADVSDKGTIGMGTLAYMAPEQWNGELPAPAGDWYAVGVALYLALTGAMPYDGKNREALVRKKLSAAPTPPSAYCADIPPDLEELCLALLERDPSARPTGAEVLRQLREGPTHARPAAAPARPLGSTFLGREAELALLTSALADSRAGATVAVLITGDSGIGKSALVRRFRETALSELDDAMLLTGRCHERESVPYKAVDGVVDALSRRLRRLPADEVAALLPEWTGALSQVFPVLRQVEAIAAAASPEAGEPIELHRRVFGALRELFVRVGERWPLVLLVDDLQWADADSMALLAEILRPPGPRLLLVATQRGPANGSLSLGELEPRHLHVTPLPAAQALELALRCLGKAGAERDGLAEMVARDTAGHPMFISELALHLAENAEAGYDGALPTLHSLDAALRRRIASLDEQAQRLLELVVVAGVPLAQSFLAEVAGLPFAELARHATTLRGARLLRTTGPHPASRAEPYHDRISQSLRAGLPTEVARAWHGRLARALEEVPGSPAELLSDHWAGAGDARRAAEHAVRAAAEAASALAFERSARLYGRALELIGSMGDAGDAAETHRLEVVHAGALINAGRAREAALVYARAGAAATGAEALDLRRRAAEAYLVSGQVDEGMATISTLLEQVGMPLPKSRAGTLLSIAASRVQLMLRGLDCELVDESRVAPELLLKLDTAWGAAMGLAVVDVIQSTWANQKFVLLALRTGERRRLVRGLVCEAVLLATGGSRSEARTAAMLERLHRLGDTIDRPYERGWMACADAMSAFLQGRFPRVIELAEGAVRDLERAGFSSSWELDTMRVLLVTCDYLTGRTREMLDRSDEYVRAARDRGDHYEATLLRTGVPCNAWLLRGDASTARQRAQEAIAGWSTRGTFVHTYLNLLAQVSIDLYEDPEGEAAWRRCRACWPALEQAYMLTTQIALVQCTELRGRAAVAAAWRAAAAPARKLLRAAEQDAEAVARQGQPPAAPSAAIIRAAVQHQRHDREGALRWLREAVAGFDAAHMALHAQVARHRLGALLGNDEGRALVASADAWMRTGRVADPERFVAMLAPGLGPRPG